MGDDSDITANYMDIAIPITGGDNAFIIYIYDNRDTVSALNSQLFLIIVQALLVGLLISVLLSFLLSKTMIIPIERLTERAEQVAAGDFGSTIEVESTDEIGILTTTFNDMASVLQETLDAVASERNKLDTLFLHMSDGVVSFASDGTVLTSNPAASQMLGREVSFYDYDELFGQQFPLWKVMGLQRPNSLSGELSVGERALELYLAPVSDGEDGGAMAVLHDVTVQRKNEEMRKEFVANVSHELRTPLTNVRSYAETLRTVEDIPRETESGFLDIIISETDRMTRIVQDLLTLSRLDSGRAEIKMVRFSLLEAIESVCKAVELEAQRRGHTLVRQYGRSLPMLTGDRSRLEQVMMNVVGNSIKYTPDGGTITVDGSLVVRQADGAVVAQHDLPGDGEAQARAAALPGAGLVHPVEAVEDALPVLLGDAYAGIGDLDPRPAAHPPHQRAQLRRDPPGQRRRPPGDGEQLPGHHHQRSGPHDPHRPGPLDPQPPGFGPGGA